MAKEKTPGQYADEMRKKLQALQEKNRPFNIAVTSIVAQVAKRAFSDGQNNVGQNFDYNSTNPIYVYDDQSPINLSHKGKTGKNKFTSGEKKGLEHATTYFKSYKEFRKKVKRKDQYVNWQLTGDLMSDYGNVDAPTNKKPPPINKDFKPATVVTVNEYITSIKRSNNVEKYDGLAFRYGEFLKMSKEEEKKFFEILDKELANFLSL